MLFVSILISLLGKSNFKNTSSIFTFNLYGNCCVICGGICYYECKPVHNCVNHCANKYFNNYIKLNNDEISIEITNRRLETIIEVDESDDSDGSDKLDEEYEIHKIENISEAF